MPARNLTPVTYSADELEGLYCLLDEARMEADAGNDDAASELIARAMDRLGL